MSTSKYKKKNYGYLVGRGDQQAEYFGKANTAFASQSPIATIAPSQNYVSPQDTTHETTPQDNGAGYTKPERAPGYNSAWQDKVNELLTQMQGRPAFQFNPGTDPVWRALADQAIVGGQRAMADTLAKATAITGGHLNSYSQAVGQQAYQGYLQQLSAHMPGVVQAAQIRYDREGDKLRDQLNLAINMERDDYGRWQDAENRRIEQEKRDEEQHRYEEALKRDQEKEEEEKRRYEESLRRDQDRWETEKEWHDQARQDALNRPSYSGGGGYRGGSGGGGRYAEEPLYTEAELQDILDRADPGDYIVPEKEIEENRFYAQHGYWPWENPDRISPGKHQAMGDVWVPGNKNSSSISTEDLYRDMLARGASDYELTAFLTEEVNANRISAEEANRIANSYI